MTTITFSTGQVALAASITAAVALILASLALWGMHRGVVQGQASIKIVPPWLRKAPEKRQPDPAPAAAASSGEGATATAAGAVPVIKPGRRSA